MRSRSKRNCFLRISWPTDQPIPELLNANYTFLNETLAKLLPDS